MLAYVLRRLLYGVVTVLGVLLFLFILFFSVASPDNMARRAVGEKASPKVIENWKKEHGYDRPLWPWQDPKSNLLFEHFRRALTFDFGKSDADSAPIVERLRAGVGPSLTLTVPLFVLGVLIGVPLSLFVAFFRDTYIDRMGLVLCVVAMSVSILLYIVGAQFLIGKLLKWFPISGFDRSIAVIARFVAMPIVVGLAAELGAEIRLYRTVFVEETSRDYVRTARAKGCGEARVMGRHVLRNALIPVLTNVVIQIPFLFTGALLLESFFGIPGLGSVTVDAIQGNDFSTLRTMVYIGALMFVVAQILTDVSYALVDPRVRLE